MQRAHANRHAKASYNKFIKPLRKQGHGTQNMVESLTELPKAVQANGKAFTLSAVSRILRKHDSREIEVTRNSRMQ